MGEADEEDELLADCLLQLGYDAELVIAAAVAAVVVVVVVAEG